MEESVRKHWLISFIFTSGAFLLFLFFPFIFLIDKKFLLFTIAWGGIAYYFGYKKNGTKWLTLVVSIQIPCILISLYQFVNLVPTNMSFSGTNLEGILQRTILKMALGWVIIFVLETYYCYCCFRLRKVNKLKESCIKE